LAKGRLVDYHVHLERGPYAEEWLQRFYAAAAGAGLSEVGLVEHGHRFFEAVHIVEAEAAKEWAAVGVADFLDLLRRCPPPAGLELRRGIEMDYIEGKEEDIAAFLYAHSWDFVIGSVHWYGTEPFDFPDGTWDPDRVDDIHREYYRLVSLAAGCGLFDTIGHFDVVKMSGQLPRGDIAPVQGAALDAIARAGLCLELSSAGWHRPVQEMYPAPGLLPGIARRGIPITLASDAHEPGEIGRDFDRLRRQAWDAGFRAVTTFADRQPRQVPLPPPANMAGRG